jgi:hypothetical protein
MRIALYAVVGLLLLLVAHLAYADLSAMFLSKTTPQNTSRFDITRNTGTNFSFSADHLTATELTNASPGFNFSAFTTGFHSDVKRFFRFTIGNLSGGCTQEVGIASSTVANNTYLGLDNQSLGIQKTGGVIINNTAIGNTGITYTTGDVIDLIIDPAAKTIQEVKNGGTPSATSSTAALGTQNVSPTISLCAINDSMVFNGNPSVSYSGAIAWDAPAPAPIISSVTASPGNFLTPSTNPVETLVANCSTGQCTGATFSLPSGATTGCTAPQVAQNNLFTISGNNLNAASTISGTPTENVGIVVTLSSASNSGTCYPLVLTGSPQLQGLCASPPPAAVAAGMTTMAKCQDFTIAIPNTAGTGLPSNTGGNCYGGQGCWLGVAAGAPTYGGSDSYPHEWYEPAPDEASDPPANGNAPQSYVRQVTDPVYGNLVLDIAAGTNRNNGYYDSAVTMSTFVRDPTDPSTQNLLFDFPMSSFTREIFRDNTNNQNAMTNSEPYVAIWKWTAAWYDENIAQYCTNHASIGGCSPMEVDDVEDWGDRADGGALHNYNDHTGNGVWGTNPSPPWDQTKYVMIDTLTTSDGSTNMKTCSWITPDGQPTRMMGCADFPGRIDPIGSRADNAGTWASRSIPVYWVGSGNGPCATCLPNPPLHLWLKTYQVWTCADWHRGSTGPNPNCFGQTSLTTAADGALFHKIITQGGGGPVSLTQTVSDALSSSGIQDHQLSIGSIPNGQAIFGAVLGESCFDPASQPGCTAGGDFDHVMVGNQRAITIGHFQDARYVGDGLGITLWWLPNVQGNPTTIDIVANGGGFWYDGAWASVFSGISPTATLDAINGGGFASGGPLGAVSGNLTSPSVTPSSANDFLYGVGAEYGCNPNQYGPGWQSGHVVSNYFGKIDEWQVDASTSPIGAIFPNASCGVAYAATVAIKPQ